MDEDIVERLMRIERTLGPRFNFFWFRKCEKLKQVKGRNLDAIKDDIQFDKTISDLDKVLLADPQTSGGLLVAVKNYDAESVLNLFVKEGYDASIIGDVIKKTEYNIFTHS